MRLILLILIISGEISEQLTPIFQENKDRPYLYWANLEYYHLVQDIQKRINLPYGYKYIY